MTRESFRSISCARLRTIRSNIFEEPPEHVWQLVTLRSGDVPVLSSTRLLPRLFKFLKLSKNKIEGIVFSPSDGILFRDYLIPSSRINRSYHESIIIRRIKAYFCGFSTDVYRFNPYSSQDRIRTCIVEFPSFNCIRAYCVYQFRHLTI